MTSTPYKFPHQSRVAQGALKETVLCSVLQLLAFIAVWLRLWSRRIVGKRLEFNDYAIFVALFLTTSLLAIAITSTVWSGKGFHTHDIDPAYRNRVWVAFTAGQPVWGAGNTAIKFSILHLYLVLFQDKMFRRACYASMVISSCYFISVVLETFLVCKPVQYNWNKNIRGTCTKHAKETYLTAGILNLLIDIFIVALPLPVLFRLRIPTWKKFGLIAVFSVGTV
ncbi:hypothetical protein GQ43DRAFT_380392 [Delitschia confertaspora ATCC 74209]|uniref:Rhodopsin domain-containing protein n=1 Tax=Delitschia confertaspora ATCC 74209 TaxID=1513339 RepID=A0A9P4JGS0_9PLEO|nr:hypothetical protein GQ43DRAFT_380392 [Delitschia confertaspora ATCC 74209]